MRKSFALVCLSLLSFCSFSQEKNFVFSHLSRDAGLRSNIANYVLKDHQGIIWIATNNGLHWYDGQRMKSYVNNSLDSTSLPNNKVVSLLEDKHNRLWAGTLSGIALYNRVHNNFQTIPIDTIKNKKYGVGLIREDDKGDVWITTGDGGPFFYDSTAKRFQPYTKVWPQSYSTIMMMVHDSQTGFYWLATDDGLGAYDPSKKKYYHYKNNPLGLPCFNDSLSGFFVGDIYYNSNCELWMSGWLNNEAYYFRYNTKTKEWLKIGNPSANTFGFFTDAAGTTWAYGEHLSFYDPKANSFVAIEEQRNSRTGIDFDEIHGMSEDDEYNLWLSSNSGVFVFNPQQQYFKTVDIYYGKDKKLVDGNINGFIETRDKTIIALSWGGNGLYFYDESFNEIPNQYGYSPSRLKDGYYTMTWSGIQDHEGLIWIGCQSGRIIVIDPEKKSIQQLLPPEFQNKTIRCIAEDRKGNIWFGTNQTTVVKWIRSEKKFKQIVRFTNDGQRLGPIFGLLVGNSDEIWAGTLMGGLVRFDINTDSVITHYESGQKNGISSTSYSPKQMIYYNQDTMVIASTKGIDIFNMRTGELKNIGDKENFPGEYAISVEVDSEKNIWFTTTDGIAKLRLPQRQITSYGFKDGITDENFFYGSVHRFSTGKMAFGNSRGFIHFDPIKVNAARPTPEARITGLSVFNKQLPIDSVYQHGNKLHLNYDENFLTLHFSAMSFLMNDKLDFYYQLEGADKDWVHAGSRREVNYSYLRGGDYTFKVKTVSKDGVPGRNIATLKIRIAQPFWNTWWFYLLCAAAIGGLLYFIYRVRVNKLLAVERVRKRVARDLHDDMGSTLSTINILSEMAKMKMDKDPTKTSEYIRKISDNSSRMMEAIDDIVWSINPMNDSMQKITARMREFATNVLEAKDIELDFKVEDAVNHLTLDMEARRDFFLIFKEAVNNVAKYSKCKHASVHISVKQQRLLLDIRDDGIGFNINSADDGNGLINMKKRADSLNGKFNINSAPGKGTEVLLNVPV